jgi:hypothetical protein
VVAGDGEAVNRRIIGEADQLVVPSLRETSLPDGSYPRTVASLSWPGGAANTAAATWASGGGIWPERPPGVKNGIEPAKEQRRRKQMNTVGPCLSGS